MFTRKSRIYAYVFLIFFIFTIFIAYFSGIVKPILYSKSEAYIKTFIEKSVNNAIIKSATNSTFSNAVSFIYNNDGSINAYKTDVLETAKLRAYTSDYIIKSLEKESMIPFKISVGTLSGIPFLFGKGPEIHINLVGMNFVTFDLASEFSDRGINQTLYRILLNIEAKSTIKEPLGKTIISTKTTIPLSETVLIGDVPEAYTVIYRAYEDDEEDINDYGASIE